jgi:hypothetical protein
MVQGFRYRLCLVALVGATGAVLLSGQGLPPDLQVPRDRGQDVSPTFDGWTTNPDGTYSLYFGYLNRNSAEDTVIPVGADNSVDGTGGPDRGQPTFFYPGRVWWIYKITVPKDFPKDQRISWTLKSRGRTNVAKGWLFGEYEVDSVLIGMNAVDRVLFSSLSEPDTKNTPPTISLTGAARRTVKLGETPTVAITAVDDGRPPKDLMPTNGVRFRWRLYRGPARVLFKPEITRMPVPSPAKSETTVTFSQPGEYRLQVAASDGEWVSTQDIDVTVTGTAARPSR